MGDPSVEVTEENKKAAYLLKAKATEATVDGMQFMEILLLFSCR